MRRLTWFALLLAAAAAGCGGDGGGGGETLPGPPNSPGAQTVRAAGCLSCHKLGDLGNDRIGGDLTRVGATLSAAEIRRSLLDPPSTMPDYRDMPAAEREALVRYLAALR